MAVAPSPSKEEVAQTLADNDEFIKKVAQTLEEKLPGNKEFAEQICTSQFTSTPMLEVPKLSSKEKQQWVRWSFGLAIGSLLIMIGVYGLSLWLGGGAKAIEPLAVPLISAFCLVVLVVNVAFNMTLSKTFGVK